MKEVRFPDWLEALAQSPMSDRQRRSHEITLRWYLSFCRRGRSAVSVQSAREFVEWARQQKSPQAWQLEQWKEALNWFFRAAAASSSLAPSVTTPPEAVWLPAAKAQWPAWKLAFLTTVRRRHYSYRTEQSYLVWVERFARHYQKHDLQELGEAEIAAFLDGLALDQRLSASSQRQALNALVFLFREVLGKQLGDFSDFRRAKVRPHLPVWLTRDEIGRLFDQLQEPWRLMAQQGVSPGYWIIMLVPC